MKTRLLITALLATILLGLLIAPGVFAESSTPLPSTVTHTYYPVTTLSVIYSDVPRPLSGLEVLVTVATVAAAVGYLANQVVNLIKPLIKDHVPDEQRNAVGRLVTLFVTALIALVAGTGAELLGLIEPGGAWLVFGTVFPATGAWFQVDSRRISAKQTAINMMPLEFMEQEVPVGQDNIG